MAVFGRIRIVHLAHYSVLFEFESNIWYSPIMIECHACIVLCIVPVDLDVKMKAVLLGGVFLVVSKISCRTFTHLNVGVSDGFLT